MKSSSLISFNEPFLTGKETDYISQAVGNKKISGDGFFTKKCHDFFEKKYSFNKCLLTTSCTDALEMSAILIDIKNGDEIIMPSYTFVSTSNAFVLRGAKIIFADSEIQTPNIDANKIEKLISSKTKAIVVVHYAGIACDMDKIMAIAKKYNLFVIEDAAQSIDSFYKGKPLGSIGHLSTFSFHETKNIMCGEGGMLVINDERFVNRAEIIREKGTNRSSFFRGEIDKYGWVDVGSSFLPSDILAAFLYSQLENLEDIQKRRLFIWKTYYKNLKELENRGVIRIPEIPIYASNNAHMFYIICKNSEERTSLIDTLKKNNISAVFHYLSLHKSPFYKNNHDGRILKNSDHYSDCLVRLPLFYNIKNNDIEFVCSVIKSFFKNE